MSLNDLNRLDTERRNPRTAEIDILPLPALLARINDEDKRVARAVEAELPQIAHAVDLTVAAFRADARLIYIGAGTSGRLGVLDASECPPTFSVPPGMVVGLIAGGDTALRRAVEGAEDNREQGAADLRAIGLARNDVVVGITASGRTPYVIGALDMARQTGSATVGLTTVRDSELARWADVTIAPRVGAEVLAGSTRMKSGTAQKLVLNMISTAAMIRIGKTYQNMMVDLSVSNEKLATRAVSIFCTVTGAPAGEARRLLKKSGNDLKLAILMYITGLDRAGAKARLAATDGVLRRAIDTSAAVTLEPGE
ncbi:N-acetylmuramic acid 6-phosphate etherase [Ovoidimarina sediminis]|uniref:N-acetylmuramic acid 6-phosphate etherase n=1 Tax=Ovoidimarina sediminis TaxID=3079856 RepID=UPI00290FED11|nr:N-acetylmuramic acid 6-phosphate etherase [Rhodophyticola sp. MJ-SS7]MDU8942917.1 N-acetylmuramic acid 6-phosphate etherase [Rhodophyticola sp. MJ-SS7]